MYILRFVTLVVPCRPVCVCRALYNVLIFEVGREGRTVGKQGVCPDSIDRRLAVRGGSSPKILAGGIAQSAPSSTSPFYPFSETEKIRTPYRHTFFQLAFESGGDK